MYTHILACICTRIYVYEYIHIHIYVSLYIPLLSYFFTSDHQKFEEMIYNSAKFTQIYHLF